MKYIISGTNRKDSRTHQISKMVQSIYQDLGEKVEIISLADLPLNTFGPETYGAKGEHGLKDVIAKVDQSEGIIFVVPEYNGSLPGALKLFIDHWKYPESFEHRPVCYVGLGGMFGGLRPVEHLQQIMGYRNAYQFPDRVFLMMIWNTLKNGELQDPILKPLLVNQAKGFMKFCKALKDAKLDANSKTPETQKLD